jgi:hypothetical protein
MSRLTLGFITSGWAMTIAQIAIAPTAIAQITPAESIPRPDKITIAPQDNSQVPADGRSRIPFAGQVLDAQGQPYLEPITVTLTSGDGKFIGADQDADRPGFQVRSINGEFTAELQSSLTPQSVTIRAAIDPPKRPDRDAKLPATAFSLPASTPVEAYTQVDFTTDLRSPIVAGSLNFRLGDPGNNFYSRLRQFLNPDWDGTSLDLDARLFAIGKVGDWRVTGAINNQAPLNETCGGTSSLFRADQLCDQTYAVHGDSSKTDYLTPSIDSVYLKLERTSLVAGAGSDYLMWGDYKSPEFARTAQVYTATDRNLHGFKANYNIGDLQATAMYGNNLEGFQRDTLQPNGTSGYYFLSRRLTLQGSENVFIELEELNRPGTVVRRENLQRGKDYEVDYDRGAILFRRPILSTEFDLFGQTLVRKIVITYQYNGLNNRDSDLYAGRLQYNLQRGLNHQSWIAGSYLKENRGDRGFELFGADAIVEFGPGNQFVAEIARSRHNSSIFGNMSGNVSGNAYRTELTSQLTPDIAARAYYRSVDATFNNNATVSFAPGQTRYGAQLAAKLSPITQAQVRVDREVNYGIAALPRTGFDALFNPGEAAIPGTLVDNSLTTLSAGLQQQFGEAGLSVDWVQRRRQDHAAIDPLNPLNLAQDSAQIVSRLTYSLTQSLLFQAQNEWTLTNGSDPLYPSRTTVGLDWRAYPGVTMRLAHQFYGNGNFGVQSITSLDTLVDYKLNENTDLTSRYSLLNGSSNWSTQGAIGLQHRWKVAPGFRVNLGYERILGNATGFSAWGPQFAQPYAVGQSATSLTDAGGDSYHIGFEYIDHPGLKFSGRYEHRNSSLGNNTLWSAAATGKLSPSWTVLGRFQQANAANQQIISLGDTTNVKVGMSYRDPNDDRFNLLFRYEYRQNPDVSPRTLLFGAGTGSQVHLGAIEALYAPNYRWEFYGKFGWRLTQSSLQGATIGQNQLTLGQFRTTYKLGYAFDLGGEVRWTHQTATGADEVGYLAELGYYITPNVRVATGYSFGRTNDIDFEGNRSRGGVYLGLNIKLDDLFGFGVQRVAPKQQQESGVKSAVKPMIQGPVPEREEAGQ